MTHVQKSIPCSTPGCKEWASLIDIPYFFRDNMPICAKCFFQVKAEVAMTAAKLTWHGNVVYCSRCRTFDENVRACLVALAYISGTPIDEIRADPLLRIDRYRTT